MIKIIVNRSTCSEEDLDFFVFQGTAFYTSNPSCILCFLFQLKNADYFSQYVTEDFNGYIMRKRESHCHGNHVEIQAMCEIYNRTIEVYQYSTGRVLFLAI